MFLGLVSLLGAYTSFLSLVRTILLYLCCPQSISACIFHDFLAFYVLLEKKKMKNERHVRAEGTNEHFHVGCPEALALILPQI